MTTGHAATLANSDDAALIEAVKAGERGALAVLYDRHAPVLLGVGIKMLGSRTEAEDVLHDVIMEAWRKASSYSPTRGSVRAWLVVRMRSRVLDRLRAPARARRASGDEAARPLERLRAQDAPEVKLKSEQRALVDAVEMLSDDLRATVVAVYLEGLSVKAAAQKLSVPDGTIKSRLSAARTRLREVLTKKGVS